MKGHSAILYSLLAALSARPTAAVLCPPNVWCTDVALRHERLGLGQCGSDVGDELSKLIVGCVTLAVHIVRQPPQALHSTAYDSARHDR